MAEGKKNRKVGRAKKSAQNLRYIGEKRHIKSHIRRLKVAVAVNPNDQTARDALHRYELML